MEDKHQVTSSARPTLRHSTQGISSSTDAKHQFANDSSSLETESAERLNQPRISGRDRPYDRKQVEIIPANEENSSSKPMNISSSALAPRLKSGSPTGPFSRTFSSARPSDNMHTILELRQGKPRATSGHSKPAGNSTATNNGSQNNKKLNPQAQGKPWQASSLNKPAGNSLNNGTTATNGFSKFNNKENPQAQSQESSNGYAQIPPAKNASISKDSRYDQVANNNRINSSKESRFEANIVLSQCLEKQHLSVQAQKLQSAKCATATADVPIGSNCCNNNNINGVENKNSSAVQVQVKIGPPSGYMNGHNHGAKSSLEVAELALRNDMCNGVPNTRDLKEMDSMSKRSSATDSGVSTNGRQWSGVSSLRSDNSVKELSSDDDDDDSGFYLQENDFDNDTFDESNSSVTSFAGRRNYLMPEKVICGVTGTVRGMRNRVRAGIATFVQPTNGSKNFPQLETSKVVVYTTSNGIVRETFQKCLKVKTILSTFLVPFEERDIFKYRAYQRELIDRLDTDQIAVPQVFVEGHYLGDANVIEESNELGKLRKILRPYKRPGAHIPCQKCGGYKLLLCNACNGSKKSVRRNRFTESLGPLRCGKCDECGLIQCDLCCKVPNEDNSMNT